MNILWDLVQPFIGWIAGGLAVIIGLWGKSKLDQRKGAKGQKAKQDAANAKETIEAHKDRDHVEDRIATDGNARDRLRSDWRE